MRFMCHQTRVAASFISWDSVPNFNATTILVFLSYTVYTVYVTLAYYLVFRCVLASQSSRERRSSSKRIAASCASFTTVTRTDRRDGATAADSSGVARETTPWTSENGARRA